MNPVRKMLAQYEILPRKRLGQSFLSDMNITRKIVALAEPAGDETIVEIGAGLGFMTEELARKAGKVIALEIDPRLIAVLRDRFTGSDRVEIVVGDVMKYDFSTSCPAGKIKIVGNIPYPISTPILFRLLEFRRSISSMVLMFQKELADRITAPPGTKEYGIPSVIIARHASVTRELTVPSTCFYPEPSVASAVLKVVMHDEPETPEEESRFVLTVRAAFARRRKTLWNNLRAAGFDEEMLVRVLQKIGIEGKRRAETLSVGEFSRLSAALAEAGSAENISAEKFLDRGESV
jgi:16S rRNA (adenine1518-N6/adenine1519-N6)-dimethyltransferase